MHLYSTKQERIQLLEKLYQEFSMSNQKIYSLVYGDLIDLGFDCTQVPRDNRVFDLSLRTIQSFTSKMKQNTSYTVDEMPCSQQYPDEDFDTYLSRLLLEPDPELFLNSLGYRTKIVKEGNKTKTLRGFSQTTTGILYLVRFYNAEIEFLKFGITNNADYEVRTKQQLRTAKRHDLCYNYEYLYISALQDGVKVYDTEQYIRLHTKIYDRVPKSLFPDGYTETVSIDALYPILLILDQHLGESILTDN